MKKFPFITMVNGTTCVKAHIFLLREKLVKLLNSQKFQEHTGEEIQIMKCYKEYMVLAGEIKKEAR